MAGMMMLVSGCIALLLNHHDVWAHYSGRVSGSSHTSYPVTLTIMVAAYTSKGYGWLQVCLLLMDFHLFTFSMLGRRRCSREKRIGIKKLYNSYSCKR